jgi:hypothetical protein
VLQRNKTDEKIAVRIEWSRALARKTRWVEEVLLLREEMRRVLRYLSWEETTWQERAGAREDQVSREILAGMNAYASRQALLHHRIATFFKKQWSVSMASAARSIIASTRHEDDEAAELDQFFGEGTCTLSCERSQFILTMNVALEV